MPGLWTLPQLEGIIFLSSRLGLPRPWTNTFTCLKCTTELYHECFLMTTGKDLEGRSSLRKGGTVRTIRVFSFFGFSDLKGMHAGIQEIPHSPIIDRHFRGGGSFGGKVMDFGSLALLSKTCAERKIPCRAFCGALDMEKTATIDRFCSTSLLFFEYSIN